MKLFFQLMISVLSARIWKTGCAKAMIKWKGLTGLQKNSALLIFQEYAAAVNGISCVKIID